MQRSGGSKAEALQPVEDRPSYMRHFAVITSPLAGHLNPLQALGRELIRAGHEVTIVHLGDAARFIRDDAIGFAPLPHPATAEPLDAYLATLAKPTGAAGFRRMIHATAAMTATLLDGAPAVLERIGADTVIADAVEPAGPLIAGRLGLPHVVAVTGLPLMPEAGVPPPFVGWRYRPGAVARWRNRGGHAVSDYLMRPISRVLDERRRDWRLAADEEPRVHVAQCPRGLDYPRSELPDCFLYSGPWRGRRIGEVQLPDDGRPLIFCSLGTLQGSRRALFGIMAEACASIGAQAVIGHGGGLTAAEEAGLPGRPLVRAFWPQEAVLRRCVAAVLHGGFNSVLDALAASVPIVALPIAFEQPATAARLVRIGAGRTLSPRGLTVRTLARALSEIIERPGYRAAAGIIAAEIAGAGGSARAAAAISASFGEPSSALAGATRGFGD
jgi:MGT family glycosyltransferase